ncbi:MAG TPA: hypothetical protein VFI96_06775 [Longimicrobiaceae bacterium]|nr:hypothetical protein [Longimicrobiaceae bacterium]
MERSRGHRKRSLWGARDIGLARLFFGALGAPAAWALHFNLVYFLDALFCTTGRTGITLAVAIATLTLGAVAVVAGIVAYRGWRDRRGIETPSAGTVRLLLAMGAIGAVLFTALIVAEGLAPFFVPACAAP